MNEPLVITRNQVRELDRRAIEDYGVPGIVLMENAGRGVAEFVAWFSRTGNSAQESQATPVVIFCGKGNNAGDGFVIARHLDNRGFAVQVFQWADPKELRGDAATNYAIIQKSGLEVQRFDSGFQNEELRARFASAACLIDALLGTGAQGPPRPPLDRVIELMNQSGKPIIAVDLPSGLDCDTGDAPGAAIRAAHTCTFVAPKPGLLQEHARPYVGELHVVDIGVPRRLVEELANGE